MFQPQMILLGGRMDLTLLLLLRILNYGHLFDSEKRI